jgi:hypothetical protein
MTLFEANYGYHPNIHREPRQKEPVAEGANLFVKKLQETQKQLSRDLEFINMQMKVYYDKKRSEGPDLKKGGKVFLLYRNIKIKRPSQKLDHVCLGPFTINKKLGPVNY